ncbi:MAG: InlB B-repeat-containing protein [Oscillibacter sp.]|uniref:InlB B-repeat-containing protein n=1 Tax=Oscillibacter sp. TaxID=1945593 RepID=UPI001D23B20A|nr:InlB B-repeat-containing protein [Oscillibacter sp.]MBS6291752.1 InlB B-repeat-containing protein [Oscillibacter sp.]
MTPSGTVGNTATAEIKEYEGFTYNESCSDSSGIIAEDGTLVLRLYYDRNEYTVTYEYEGTVPAGAPEVPGEQTCKYGETVELAKMPDVTDYRFSGWYSEDVALSGGSFTMPDYAVVIEGSFSQLNSYTVTYDLNGGTTTSPQTVFPGLAYGDKTPRIEDPTKEPSELYSYEFTGWSPEIADTVTGDITYRAEYTRTEREFTVTYYLDGTLYAEPESYTYGETVVIKKQAEDATEWTTNDLQESDIIEGLFYMPEHNVVFTATTDGTVTPDECTYTVVYHQYDDANMKDVTYNVILDAYGYMIGIEQNEDPDQYVFLTGIDGKNSNLSVRNADANVIFMDGNMDTVTVNMTKSDIDTTGKNLSQLNTWCTYTVNNDNVYTLKEVAVSTSKNVIDDDTDVAQYAQDVGSNGATIDKKHVSLKAANNSSYV